MSILDLINKPQDLKFVKPELLPELAHEIRTLIVNTVSKTGGHLGASLGCVELAIALHHVFDSPNDKIVWDTGHQAYAHKILTGRRDKFHTIRQHGGLSGFLSRSESEHDAFGAGHASTSISASLGLACARDQLRQNWKVVAVANDGSLTGGMAFEGLQNAGHIGTDLLVILNDNQIFISHRVGALGSFLAKLLTLGMVKRLEKKVERFLTRLHFWGACLLRVAKRFKVLLFPGMLFEEMGFTYLGPVDGHDIHRLIEVLKAVKELKGPVFLHVVTKKGRGYEPAETEPIKYHGVARFNPETGEMVKAESGPPSYTKIFSNAITRLAKENRKIVAITAAMPEGTGLDAFRDEFPDRFYDVGIAEQHAVTFAAGLACEGVIPVVVIYSSFLQRAFDQILHDVALQKLHVVFCLDRSGIVGDDGPTHHGTYDLSYLRMIPNLTIMAPRDENELQHMLKTAVNMQGPAAIRYPRGNGAGIPLETTFRLIPLGRGEILREGTDIVLLGIGNVVHSCLQASEMLNSNGIPAAVVDAKFVKPLDLNWLQKTLSGFHTLVTVEDNVLAGGFGSAVMEALEEIAAIDPSWQKPAVHRIGLPDTFIEHGEQNILRRKYGISSEEIAKRVVAAGFSLRTPQGTQAKACGYQRLPTGLLQNQQNTSF